MVAPYKAHKFQTEEIEECKNIRGVAHLIDYFLKLLINY